MGVAHLVFLATEGPYVFRKRIKNEQIVEEFERFHMGLHAHFSPLGLKSILNMKQTRGSWVFLFLAKISTACKSLPVGLHVMVQSTPRAVLR